MSLMRINRAIDHESFLVRVVGYFLMIGFALVSIGVFGASLFSLMYFANELATAGDYAGLAKMVGVLMLVLSIAMASKKL
jgi:hypothetical protein